MANRYNNYTNVDYVNLPIDSYQSSLGALEGENLKRLQEAKSVYDGLQNVEAVYNPDLQLKSKILDDLKTRISGIANKKLNNADALIELSGIVNDRKVIDDLSNIYINTQNYKSGIAANKEYEKTYGNDINTVKFNDEVQAYNQLGPEGFRSRFLDQYQPDKFVDVVGDMQKVLEKAKADGWEESQNTGNWIHKTLKKELPIEKLLQQSGMMLKDPKYQNQLQNLSYYNLRKYGGTLNPTEGVRNFNTQQVAALDNQITDISNKLSTLKEEQLKAGGSKTKEGLRYARIIEEGVKAVQNLAQQRDAYKGDTQGALFNADMLSTLAHAASAPYYYKESTKDIEANPFALAERKANLAFNNAYKMHNIKRADKLADEANERARAQELEFQNRPIPTMHNVTLQDASGNLVPKQAFQFDVKGGYNSAAVAETIAGALNKGGGITGVKTVGAPLEGMQSAKDSETLKQGIASGKYQAFYVPDTKEYMITDGKQQIRVVADQGTQAAMDPLYKLGTVENTKQSGVYFVPGVSLDGRSTTTIIADKEKYDSKAAYYQPISDPYDLDKLSDKDFNNLMGGVGGAGMTTGLSKNALKQAVYDGVYVAVKGHSNQSNIDWHRFERPLEYEQYIKNTPSFNPKLTQYVLKQGNNITIVSQVPGGEGDYKMFQSHIKYHTNKGGEFRNLMNKDLFKTEKKTTKYNYEEDVDNPNEIE